MSIPSIKTQLQKFASPKKAKILQGFFKTGPGEYGEGDIFLGITVPQLRGVAKAWLTLSDQDILAFLKSPLHEERLLALLILVEQFQKALPPRQEQIFHLYRQHTPFINNWDLVDLSAPKIVGKFLFDKDRAILYQWAQSSLLCERRIAIVATFYFIKNQQWDDTLTLSRHLLADREELLHKAVGWMLREVGKQSQPALETFLKAHYQTMPRTMLRYAIERFPETKRKAYLRKQ
jgi:3-methyladenine DNA glycosylase AlkD